MNSLKQVQLQTQFYRLKEKSLDKSLNTILKRIMGIIDSVSLGLEHLIAKHRVLADTCIASIEKGIRPSLNEGLIQDIVLNEGKLEAFEQILNSLIQVRYMDPMAPNNSKKDVPTSLINSRSERLIKTLELPKIKQQQGKIVCNIDWITKSLQMYDLETRHLSSFALQDKHIYPFNSHIYAAGSIYVSGGAIPHSNNKSGIIYRFDCQSGIMAEAGLLLEARSSHATIYKHPYIYIVGGNRHNHIITKSCQKYNVISRESGQIACLNHCASCVALTLHNDKYIYKFGGVGEKFESYGMSPYIERYVIEDDCWEVINPDFAVTIQSRDHFQYHLLICRVLSFSCAFNLNNDTIVVMGGYDKSKQPYRLGYSLQINEEEHQLIHIDEAYLPQSGGFWHNSPICNQGKLYFAMNSGTSNGSVFVNKILLEYDGITFRTLN